MTSHAPPLVLAGSATALATLVLAAATTSSPVQRVDDAIERFADTHRALVAPVARFGTLPGERFVHPVIGALTAAAILLSRRQGDLARVVVPLAAASLGAIVAHHAVKFVYRRPRPAGALARGKTEAAYPSGHTADATAVVFTSAWLLVREGLVPLELALAAAVALALVTGISRVALGWHWATDVLGGWLTGMAVASQCVLLYEHLA